ncbi:multicomponent Na+:H+ antiporter subunit E [Actinobaculum suis]|uniref:Multicomponent Na+:H+ antiporter subunit E n=1 Tax=Actinobaculum suis TaxID=1657 RepID=A0A0K9ERX0_9ACTO|nr:Na+/H+ antiporter subunit E [Actinobaculum suis]KMY22933.1 sodium:proton antiporter [Actinobaculum suis]MDY5152536.1 Na+/H+ antiporter subunit E [Actinobaculum suis]OCA94371.1 sodium:proton antiporter [Actinobaculum suis]OCA94766.1 sodium:proton antiporter [Actinobaculum suis]SDE39823.1 multicomponent Na+:H+ antiporter subunit E [Actinobaculum suis]
MSRASEAIRIATRSGGRFPKASLGLLVWLTMVWVLLWGEVSAGNVVAGFALALLVTEISPFPATDYDARFRPRALIRLFAIFFKDLVVASTQMAWFIFKRKEPRGAVIRVRLRSQSDLYLFLTSCMSTLVPGSLVIDTDADTGTLYVHVFDVELAGGVSAAHKSVLDLEERVLRALASGRELVAAGFVPGASPKAGRLPTPFAPDSSEEAA